MYSCNENQQYSLAVTRQFTGNPVGFLPVSRVAANPNTAAGGRAVPEPTASTSSSAQHRLLAAAVGNLSTACSLLDPVASQALMPIQLQLQRALQSGSKEEQARLTASFFQQFSSVAAEFHKPALTLVMTTAAAGLSEPAAAAAAAAAGPLSQMLLPQQQPIRQPAVPQQQQQLLLEASKHSSSAACLRLLS